MTQPMQSQFEILPVINAISRARLWRGWIILSLTLACFGLIPTTWATDTGSVLPNANTADGSGVLINLSNGVWNSGFGFQALYHDTSGSYNTATGVRALFSNTTGRYNAATGVYALYSNTTANYNTAAGYQALYFNNASGNTAYGYQALFRSTTGQQNSAIGFQALRSNTTGYSNTANGVYALYSNTTGYLNTANGIRALGGNTTGGSNTANGVLALSKNTDGYENTADGVNTLSSNTTGYHNTACGVNSLSSVTTGSNNIGLGYLAGLNINGSNNIDIGNPGVTGESNTIRVGDTNQTKTFIAGIRGITTTNMDAVNVVIDSAGQLGTVSSSKRSKKDIKPMDKASEAILKLRPVTFSYKTDHTDASQFGLIAEEVAQIDPDLVVRDEKGEIYTVRYDAVNAMLLNEFLKEHRKVEQQDRQLRQQAEAIAKQQKQIEALTSSLQKVNDKLELSVPRVVANER